MKELLELYNTMGISSGVYAYGEKTLENLKERFAEIDKIAEHNQAKVIAAMQKNRVSATVQRVFLAVLKHRVPHHLAAFVYPIGIHIIECHSTLAHVVASFPCTQKPSSGATIMPFGCWHSISFI